MKKFIKATILDVIVAFLIIILIIFSIYMLLGQTIEESITLINQVAIKVENSSKQEEMKISEDNRLENYPEYGRYYIINCWSKGCSYFSKEVCSRF